MRYVAKIHVIDVMDTVVVSGYVLDSDPLSDPEHEVHEFTWQLQGYGLNSPVEWLRDALLRGAAVIDAAPQRVI